MRAVPDVPDWNSPARRALQPVQRSVAGQRMMLHPADNFTEYRLWRDGQPPEPMSIERLVGLVAGRCALIVDIGANCGTYALALAAAASPGSRIIAVEPNPVMAARCRTNLALNGAAVEVREIAVGGAAGVAMLTLNDRNFGEATLNEAAAGATRISVPVLPLTAIVPQGDFSVFVVKVDVEGYEDRVIIPYLRSDAALPGHILIEVDHAAEWIDDLHGTMTAAGYSPVFVGEGNALFQRHKV